MTTARHALPSAGAASDPGGHRGSRTQTPPLRDVPRGHPASALAHVRRPFETKIVPPGAHGALLASARTDGAHRPVPRSRRSSEAQGRNSHPLAPIRAAGPQNASPADGVTHAPSTATVPSTHAHRPVASGAASRGHAAAA
jgi:hypothetical protein